MKRNTPTSAPTLPHDDGRRADPRVLANRVDLLTDWRARADARTQDLSERVEAVETSAEGLTRTLEDLSVSVRRTALAAAVAGLLSAALTAAVLWAVGALGPPG